VTATQDSGDITTETAVPAEKPGERRRIRLNELDLRNTWQVIAGSILLPLGVAVIILGWHGAAYGNVDQKQIPYLISGGILGLAIVIVGCFFYWAHWLYRIYDQADLHHQEMIREQREMIRALVGSGFQPQHMNGASPASDGRGFVVTATGSNFHAPGCPLIANRMANARTISEEEARDMRPCRVCEPLGATS
jgi:hypothetical protein